MNAQIMTDLHAPITIGSYSIRPLTMADLPAWHSLLTRFLQREYGSSNITLEMLQADWNTPGLDVSTAMRGAFTPDGTLVAMAEVWDVSAMPVRPWFDFTLDEGHEDQALADHFLAWGEARVRQVLERVPADARVTMCTAARADKTWRKAVLEKHGMITNRRSLTMQIDFNGQQPPAPEFPAGITVRSMADGVPLRELLRIWRETFRDHRGYVDEPLDTLEERWSNYIAADPNFDPSLNLLAVEGEGADAKPAGVIMCRLNTDEDPDTAWVSILGVMPEYRRKGVGMALLRYAFNAFYKRGKPRAGLGVDGSSLTNATKLYERAGMYVKHAYDAYEKVLRDGVELSKQ